MPPPSSPNPRTQQDLHQFLSTVLSQNGPFSLPYPESSKQLIRHHLITLIQTYPSLSAKTASYTHNDGRTVNLLQTDGTIPILFQNATYNIPVVIWLIESYPRDPPCIYVVPTHNMIIKRPHHYVNPSGLVCSVPYLQKWIYPSSNLVDLVTTLSHLFGIEPPLYSRQSYNPNPTPNPNFHPTPSRPSFSNSNLHVSKDDNRMEVFRKNAITKLSETITRDIQSMRSKREVEMEGLFNVQAKLRQREDQLSKGLREMHEEIGGLEQQLQIILMNTDVTEAWLRENEAKKRTNQNHIPGSVDGDDNGGIEPSDVLSKQMLECTASDLAIDDLIYSLDKAVQEGSIGFDQYLKNVRSLSRQQFFHRATSAKVKAVQVQTQVAHMAARASPYAV